MWYNELAKAIIQFLTMLEALKNSTSFIESSIKHHPILLRRSDLRIVFCSWDLKPNFVWHACHHKKLHVPFEKIYYLVQRVFITLGMFGSLECVQYIQEISWECEVLSTYIRGISRVDSGNIMIHVLFIVYGKTKRSQHPPMSHGIPLHDVLKTHYSGCLPFTLEGLFVWYPELGREKLIISSW